MRIKPAYIKSYDKIFEFTEDIKEFESRREMLDSWKDNCLEFDGHEAYQLREWFEPLRTIPYGKESKINFFEYELTQESFESNPLGSIRKAKSFNTQGDLPHIRKEIREVLEFWNDILTFVENSEYFYRRHLVFIKNLNLYRKEKTFLAHMEED